MGITCITGLKLRKKKILKREKQKYNTTSYWHIWVQRNKHCLWSFN